MRMEILRGFDGAIIAAAELTDGTDIAPEATLEQGQKLEVVDVRRNDRLTILTAPSKDGQKAKS